jgi:hypothetical protein
MRQHDRRSYTWPTRDGPPLTRTRRYGAAVLRERRAGRLGSTGPRRRVLSMRLSLS